MAGKPIIAASVRNQSAAADGQVTRAAVCARPTRSRLQAQFRRMDERELFRRVAGGSRNALEELTARYMPLARSIAMRYRRSSAPLEDLNQVAALGLLNAIKRYDPSRAVTFSSYAVPTIAGELKRYFRDHSWAVRPPRGLQELTARADRATMTLTQQFGRAPTTAELSAVLDSDEETLLEAIQAGSSRAALSLNTPAGDDGGLTLEDRVGHDDGGIRSAETHAVLAALLPSVTERERDILRMRFDEDMTQAQMAAILGVSQMGVSRSIRQALRRLRSAAAQPPRISCGRRAATQDARRSSLVGPPTRVPP
jgi:RNA polymerase sigma-B factor